MSPPSHSHSHQSNAESLVDESASDLQRRKVSRQTVLPDDGVETDHRSRKNMIGSSVDSSDTEGESEVLPGEIKRQAIERARGGPIHPSSGKIEPKYESSAGTALWSQPANLGGLAGWAATRGAPPAGLEELEVQYRAQVQQELEADLWKKNPNLYHQRLVTNLFRRFY
ncbi:hypothetical protein T439DRAFT_360683 [Meredithblackwellia eburnea MCA 4105]